MTRIERIGNATLYLADCREVLPTLRGVDAVVTDPPYGVGLLGKATKYTLNRPTLVYQDDDQHFADEVLPRVSLAIAMVRRALVFSGIRKLHDYPAPREIGGIICPNGGGRSAWGFGCYHPALLYGVSPYISAGMGGRPTVSVIYHPGMHVTGEKAGNDHPCPKPIVFMGWAVETASLEGETILDPFMGSGTTGVACARLGRRFIGIEIEERYFNIACERIEQAHRQPDLFIHGPPANQSSEQLSFLREVV